MAFKIGSPTSTAIKICGITKGDQAKAIASLGVDAIGVVGVEDSPRFVLENQRRKLFSQLSNYFPNVERVWVIANMNDVQIMNGLKGQGIPSVIQLHGKESPKRCEELRKRYSQFKWWKAIRVETPLDIAKAQNFEAHTDALLLDAWSPIELGGTGEKIPLEWLQKANFKIPWWLAGGISAKWIPEIFSRQISPFGIDASSRLEISPGIKDLKLVKALIKSIEDPVRQIPN